MVKIKERIMKKKQKKKLLTQFRPSLDTIREKLFSSMEEKIQTDYGRLFKLGVEKKDKLFLVIHPEKESGEERILIPIDNNFTAILKQIQAGKPAIFDSFRDKLLLEVVSIWGQHRTPLQLVSSTKKEGAVESSEAKKTPASKSASTEKVEKTEPVEAKQEELSTLTLDELKEAISTYPKFFVETTSDSVTIHEQAATGPKLLATISMTELDSFSVEKALDRKYKVKLTLIPLIEAFSKTPLEER